MRYPRFSIKVLMLAMVCLGVVFASLAQPTMGWALVLSHFVILLLLVAILGTILSRDRRRAFWIGFAVFGWCFFGLYAWADPTVDPRFGGQEDDLLGTLALPIKFVFEIMEGLLRKKPDLAILADIVNVLRENDTDSRLLIAFSVVVLVFAFLGGGIAVIWSRASERRSRPEEGTR